MANWYTNSSWHKIVGLSIENGLRLSSCVGCRPIKFHILKFLINKRPIITIFSRMCKLWKLVTAPPIPHEVEWLGSNCQNGYIYIVKKYSIFLFFSLNVTILEGKLNALLKNPSDSLQKLRNLWLQVRVFKEIVWCQNYF